MGRTPPDPNAPWLENLDALRRMKDDDVTAVKMLTANDEYVCATCAALGDRSIPIDEAIRLVESGPRCTSHIDSGDEWNVCRCSWAATEFMGTPLG